MKAKIVNKNTASVEICKQLWRLVPAADSWHLAVLYNGNETCASDIKNAFDFVCYEDYACIIHCALDSFSCSNMAALFKQIALYCKNENISTIQYSSQFIDCNYDIQTLNDILKHYFSFQETESIYVTECIMPKLSNLLHTNFNGVKLSTFSETSGLISKFKQEAKNTSKYFTEDYPDAFWTDTEYLLLSRYGKPVGFLTFWHSIMSRKTIIYHVYIEPHYRRQGLGTRLVNYLMCLLGMGTYIFSTDTLTEGTTGFAKHLGLTLSESRFTVNADKLLQDCGNIFTSLSSPAALAGGDCCDTKSST